MNQEKLELEGIAAAARFDSEVRTLANSGLSKQQLADLHIWNEAVRAPKVELHDDAQQSPEPATASGGEDAPVKKPVAAQAKTDNVVSINAARAEGDKKSEKRRVGMRTLAALGVTAVGLVTAACSTFFPQAGAEEAIDRDPVVAEAPERTQEVAAQVAQDSTYTTELKDTKESSSLTAEQRAEMSEHQVAELEEFGVPRDRFTLIEDWDQEFPGPIEMSDVSLNGGTWGDSPRTPNGSLEMISNLALGENGYTAEQASVFQEALRADGVPQEIIDQLAAKDLDSILVSFVTINAPSAVYHNMAYNAYGELAYDTERTVGANDALKVITWKDSETGEYRTVILRVDCGDQPSDGVTIPEAPERKQPTPPEETTTTTTIPKETTTTTTTVPKNPTTTTTTSTTTTTVPSTTTTTTTTTVPKNPTTTTTEVPHKGRNDDKELPTGGDDKGAGDENGPGKGGAGEERDRETGKRKDGSENPPPGQPLEEDSNPKKPHDPVEGTPPRRETPDDEQPVAPPRDAEPGRERPDYEDMPPIPTA